MAYVNNHIGGAMSVTASSRLSSGALSRASTTLSGTLQTVNSGSFALPRTRKSFKGSSMCTLTTSCCKPHWATCETCFCRNYPQFGGSRRSRSCHHPIQLHSWASTCSCVPTVTCSYRSSASCRESSRSTTWSTARPTDQSSSTTFQVLQMSLRKPSSASSRNTQENSSGSPPELAQMFPTMHPCLGAVAPSIMHGLRSSSTRFSAF